MSLSVWRITRSRRREEGREQQATEVKANGRTTIHRLFGFLLGTVGAGGALYYYVVDQYKVSNEMLTEDIYVRFSSMA